MTKRMLKHVLMFRLKDKTKGAQEIKAALEALPQAIPEILAYEVGINVSQSPAASDLFLYSEFEDEAALERYRRHPEHQKVLKLIEEFCSEKTVVDYWC